MRGSRWMAGQVGSEGREHPSFDLVSEIQVAAWGRKPVISAPPGPTRM
jgi:hypothetical protein